MQVNLTEDDLRAIWRDLYTAEVARLAVYYRNPVDAAKSNAKAHADDHVAFLRSEAKAIDDAIAAEVAVRPPAEWARTAEEEREDAIAYLCDEEAAASWSEYNATDPAERDLAAGGRSTLCRIISRIRDGVHVGRKDRGVKTAKAPIAEPATPPPAPTTRTADDERRDAVAYLVESARCRQVTDYDSAVIAEGRHVGAAGLYGPGREVRPVSPGQPAKVAHRTAEDERRDVVAFVRARNAAQSIAPLRPTREAAFDDLALDIETGDHVGAADRAEVKP